MAVKPKGGAQKMSPATQKLIWYLAIVFGVMLMVMAISIAFKSSTGKPREARQSLVRIDMNDTGTAPLTRSAQFQKGSELVRSSSADDRVQGMSMLMTVNAVKAAPQVMALLADPYPQVRAQAASLLSTYNVPNVGPQLASLLTDADPGVRQAAANALPPYAGDPSVLYALNGPLSARDPSVLQTAMIVWKACAAANRDAGLQAVRSALTGSDDALLSQVLAEIQAVYQPYELSAIRYDLEQIRARMAGQSSGNMADGLLRQLDS